MTNFEVRELSSSEEDIKAYQSFLQMVWQSDAPHLALALKGISYETFRHLSSGCSIEQSLVNGRIIIGFEDGQIVGGLLTRGSELLGLIILPGYERLGLGKTLVSKIVDLLRKDDHNNTITVLVDEKNSILQSFYRSLGFKGSEVIEESWFGKKLRSVRLDHHL